MDTAKYRRLTDVPVRTLRQWLRRAESKLGKKSATAKALRRAINAREEVHG